MELLSTSRLVFSLKCYIGAMLAFYVALSLDLERPYWAIVSAYIISQPLAGAVRSKAVYRICGSFIGAAATVLMVPNFVNEPLLLSLVLSLWVSFCLYISVLDRTPRSYIFLLAGYTAGIIGFPSVNAPNDIFNDAVTRFEEITIGIIGATFTHSIFFPERVTAALSQSINKWWLSIKQLMQDIFPKKLDQKFAASWKNLAAEVTQIYILSTHLSFDTANMRNTAVVLALDARMADFLVILYVIADRLLALHDDDSTSDELAQLTLKRIELLFSENENTNDIDEKIKRLTSTIVANSSWYDILKMSLSSNLNHLLQLYLECHQLRLYLFSYTPLKLSQEDLLQSYYGKNRPLHRDYKIAFLSSLATFIAMMSICLFWIATAWPNGDTAAQLAAIACCFFASQIDPVPFIMLFIYCVIATIPIGALYQFAILPRVDGFFMLSLVFAPFYLLCGYLMATPRTFVAGIAAILALTNLVLLQQQYSADFAVYLNVCIALLIGMGAAALSNHFFRSMGREWNIRHLLSTIRHDLANIAAAKKPANETVFTLRTIDTLGMLTPLTSDLPNESIVIKGIRALSVGRYIILLQSAIMALPTNISDLIRHLLSVLTKHFRTYRLDQYSPLSPQILELIDALLTEVTAMPETAARTNVILGLCGLRRNLFPDAMPYKPSIKGETI